jgi:CheY-like chemotaxis protein
MVPRSKCPDSVPRILVVDHNPGIRRFVHRILRKFEVTTVQSAAEACRLAARLQDPVDLLIVQFDDAGMNRKGLVREFRKHFPRIRILFTGETVDHEVVHEHCYWLKAPFSAYELKQKLEKIFSIN